MRSVFGDKNIEMIDMIMNLPVRQIPVCCSLFVFKLYHYIVTNSTATFVRYEKSPNSFLPGLSRSIINQFRSGGQRYSAGLRQRWGRRGRSCCRLRRDGRRDAVGMGASAPCLTHFWPRTRKKWAVPDGNNGKSAERTVVKSTNRSRNGSDLPLRQPTDQKAGGSNPSRRATPKSLLAVMISGFFIFFCTKKLHIFGPVNRALFPKEKICLTPV